MPPLPSVHAVVVAHNRRDLLAEALTAVLRQSLRVDRVHVVDNASADGTAEMVRRCFPVVTLHALPTNTGGAGGFATGVAHALASGADVLWLLDDDTVPAPDALAALMRARQGYPGRPPAAVASRVRWTDGRDHPMNTPRPRPGARRAAWAAAAAVGCMPVRSASFVSVIFDADAVRRSGLPEADFFVWNDDFEFSTRLLRHAPGLYCPASVVEHRTGSFGATDADPGARFYYEVRNKVWIFGHRTGLSPWEKTVYGGSTLRRWARTLARSEEPMVLLDGLRRGLSDGVRTSPRPPRDVLAEAGVRLPDLAAPRR